MGANYHLGNVEYLMFDPENQITDIGNQIFDDGNLFLHI
jgi:hypothetical protein